MYSDILIVGAGVMGCALARELGRYEATVTVLERGHDVAEGASKANSGIVHAGFDAAPGSLKAKLNVEGAKMMPALCAQLGVPYRQNGALVVAYSQRERRTLEALLERGRQNGVSGLEMLEREALLALELNANPEAVCALHAPTSGIVSPYELTYALADHAAVCGAAFRFNAPVERIERAGGLWRAIVGGEVYRCGVLILCAGADGVRLREFAGGRGMRLIPRRGQYVLLDRPDKLPFERTMFMCPTERGKGALVAPTVHGNVLLGPSAEDISDAEDTATTAAGLEGVLEACRKTWPGLSVRSAVTNFSGVRAHEEHGDFVIGRLAENAYEAAGIESPGLSAAPAAARMLAGQIAREQGLSLRARVPMAPAREKPFSEMTDEERGEAVRRDPLHGRIVCRCEMVTEAEIRAAIRRPVGATSVDGVKRRTRAGMGRCQGGFCSPRVMEILAQEWGVPMTEVTKSGSGSRLLTGTIREAMKRIGEEEEKR
ncbi:MAG: NAD(P)/FAD-dependent oxidoreductase [Clostridia bacterium]|nr:NAD(P)/FAD-dependent oxidoreductase [Clostridia bacterium]